jgi:hypothetical protein
MIITCTECHMQVSSAAAACPHCGRPMQAPVTIQKTGRTLKAHMLIGVALMIFGIGSCMIAASTGDTETGGSLGVVTVIGACWYATARATAWWRHG